MMVMRLKLRYLLLNLNLYSSLNVNTYIMTNSIALAKDILDFWFGIGKTRGKSRPEWFRKDAAFDEEIRTRFLPTYEEAAAGHLAHWQEQAHDCLALIVLLDQFPRNMFRNDARAFATDHLALAATHLAIEKKFDLPMRPVERQFIYLPLEHSESLADQSHSLTMFNALAAYPETRDLHLWAGKHRVIIERFGRFPHRNAALGRESTAVEAIFLTQPDSGF